MIPIIRFIRKSFLATLLKFDFKALRDNKQARDDSPLNEHGWHFLADMPNEIVDEVADTYANILVDDDTVALHSRVVCEQLRKSKAVTKWFTACTGREVIDQERLRRHVSTFLCEQGRKKIQDSSLEHARRFFECATEADGNNNQAWQGLGDSLEALGLIDQANLARTKAQRTSA